MASLDHHARRAPGGSIQVLSRATGLLRILHTEPAGLSLSGLAEQSGLPRSTVHRLLAALEVEGLVATGPDGRMGLGPELFRLSALAVPPVEELLAPAMDALHAEVEETVDLAVLDGDHLRFVQQRAAAHRLSAVSAVGDAFPLHCTANGKAVLALMTDEGVKALLPPRLPRWTPSTLTSRRAVLDALSEIRTEGLAYDREEHTEGISAIGFAVGDPTGLHGAITVPVPTQRFARREAMLASALARTHRLAEAALMEWQQQRQPGG